MTCKDCIHHDVCQYGDLVNCEGCFDFKNKADVQEVKRGEWESHGEGYSWVYQCSECGWIDGHPFYERFCFCPNCGARMDGEKNYEKDKAYCAAVEMAIEALYKQIPKKPHKNTQFPNFLCPSCGGFTYLYDEYCEVCGQALDWSDSR